MINPVKSFLTHGPLILKEIYTNKFQKYTHTIITRTSLNTLFEQFEPEKTRGGNFKFFTKIMN